MRIWVLVLGGMVVALVVWFWQPIVVHLSQESGTSNGTSRAYDFWSGIAGCLGYTAILSVAWKHLNCHTIGCWRIGHMTPKGYRLCKTCVAKPVDDLDLHPIDESHQ